MVVKQKAEALNKRLVIADNAQPLVVVDNDTGHLKHIAAHTRLLTRFSTVSAARHLLSRLKVAKLSLKLKGKNGRHLERGLLYVAVKAVGLFHSLGWGKTVKIVYLAEPAV